MEFPEEPGYQNSPGWVKGNPLNNDSYVAKCTEEYSEYAEKIQDIYNQHLERGVPFNVVQIKVKFGELCFYTQTL